MVICLFDASKDSAQVIEKYKKDFGDDSLIVANKSDKLTTEQASELKNQDCLVISAKHNQGTDILLKAIQEAIAERFTASSGLLISRQRYREALRNVVNYLSVFGFDKEIELTTEDIRLSAREIGKITGRIEVDEILDKIFGSFCIGK